MSRNVQIVLLCEDRQQEVFLRRFLKKAGWSTRRIRPVFAPQGHGSAEQFVRERFPIELAVYRRYRNHVDIALIVMIDGDNKGVVTRLRELDNECQCSSIQPPKDDDRVAVFVPTWNIETWLAYLDGEEVEENKSDYPRLNREGECQRHVDALDEMCRSNQLRQLAPASLEAACNEYRLRLLR